MSFFGDFNVTTPRAGRTFLQALRVTCARVLSFPLHVPRSHVLFQSFFFAYQDSRSRVLAFQILLRVPVSRSSTEKYFTFLKHNCLPVWHGGGWAARSSLGGDHTHTWRVAPSSPQSGVISVGGEYLARIPAPPPMTS